MRRTFWAEYGDSAEKKEYFCNGKRRHIVFFCNLRPF